MTRLHVPHKLCADEQPVDALEVFLGVGQQRLDQRLGLGKLGERGGGNHLKKKNC